MSGSWSYVSANIRNPVGDNGPGWYKTGAMWTSSGGSVLDSFDCSAVSTVLRSGAITPVAGPYSCARAVQIARAANVVWAPMMHPTNYWRAVWRRPKGTADWSFDGWLRIDNFSFDVLTSAIEGTVWAPMVEVVIQ